MTPLISISYAKCGCATVQRSDGFVVLQEMCEICTAGVVELIAYTLRQNAEREAEADLFTPESGSDQRPQS